MKMPHNCYPDYSWCDGVNNWCLNFQFIYQDVWHDEGEIINHVLK